MPDINASSPVVVEGSSSVTYDKWFLSQLIAKINPDKAFTVVHLTRSATVDGKTVLMPKSRNESEVSFTLDVWKEMQDTPELAAAMDAVLTAVLAYANKKKLI